MLRKSALCFFTVKISFENRKLFAYENHSLLPNREILSIGLCKMRNFV